MSYSPKGQKRIGLLAFSALILLACAPPTLDRVPVQIGGEADFDACPGVGKIGAMETNSTATQKVYAKPDPHAKVVGHIKPGEFVWMCDWTEDAKWIGILYSHRKDGRIRCEVSSPIEVRRAYDGPCHQGWVPEETVLL